MKVQLPWLGNARGRSGNMIYQCYRGKTYMREIPFMYHYPGSKAQIIQSRRFLDLVNAWMIPYSQLAPYISKTQRIGRNIYDTLLKPLYKVVYRYGSQSWPKLAAVWGLDLERQVSCSFRCGNVVVSSDAVDFPLQFVGYTSSRQFEPYQIFVLVVCINKVQILLTRLPLTPDVVSVSLKNRYGWNDADTICIFAAARDKMFFSNFYKPDAL